jgi:hypothetical protein
MEKDDVESGKTELSNLWARMISDEIHDGPVQDARTYAFALRWFSYAYENCLLAARKQADYGSNNISVTGLYGVAVRCLDKVSRLLNLTKGRSNMVSESVDDTLADLSNYGIIGQMVGDGTWGVWDR